MSIREAQAKLCEGAVGLQAGDFKYFAYMITRNSLQIYQYALAKRWGDWLLLWTEHHGYHVHHVTDIEQFRLFTKEEAKFLTPLFSVKAVETGFTLETLPTV